jgi:hypothetical protein
MAVRTQTRVNERQGSIEVISQRANHPKSMEILAKHGLRPLTYREALSRSSELINTLKGKWFYLDGQGMQKFGIHTFNEKGKLVGLTGNESIDQKVRVWPGNNPLSLLVYSDDGARDLGRRYELNADDGPSLVAPVVVGVKAGREAAAPKTSKINPEVENDLREALDGAKRVYEPSSKDHPALVRLTNAAEAVLKELER